MSDSPLQPEKRFAAACGLFCPGCSLYIGTQEDPARLELMAVQFNLPVEQLQCDGCRAERRGFYCQQCKMISCTKDKGIEFCIECDEYPCAELEAFQAEMPHRINLWDDLARIKDVGYEAWFQEMVDRYACPECGVINSAYDLACRKCGCEPGNEYVKAHREAIEKFMSAMMNPDG
jgi:hypothetical protein